MKFQVLNVTPTLASNWLKRNTINRPVRTTYVRRIADAMLRGEWMATHQPIALNGKKLVDGQHRLLGLLKSGLPSVQMSVVSGADTGIFDCIDIGVNRTHSDIFKEDRFVMHPISFIARLVYGLTHCTPKRVEPVYEKYIGIMRDISRACANRTNPAFNKAGIKTGALAAILAGSPKTYVLDQLRYMTRYEVENLVPCMRELFKQLTQGVTTPKAKTGGQSRQTDTASRCFKALQKKNADYRMLRVGNEDIKEIRVLFMKDLGIEVPSEE